MSGQIKVSAYGGNGPLTETFHYKIEGKRIHETLDIDLNSPTYGKTLSVKVKEGGQLVEVGPNGFLGRMIYQDENSHRQTSYLNEMDYIKNKAIKAGYGTVHDEALKNSEMYEIATGLYPYNVHLPAVTYTVDTTTTEISEAEELGRIEREEYEWGPNGQPKAEKQESITNPPPTERIKGFTGLLQYPANAHYNDRSRPTQDHMKIDMFQYQAPTKNLLPEKYGEKDNTNNKNGNVTMSRLKDAGWWALVPGGRVLPNPFNQDKATDNVNVGRSEKDTLKFADVITKGIPRNTTLKKYLGTVKMPIPNQLRTGNGVSWGEGRANAFETASFMGAFSGIRRLMKGESNFAQTIQDGIGGIGEVIKKFGGGQAGDANDLLASAAARAALASINVNTDPNQMMTRAFGKAVNPNLELLFAGPKLRSFQFTFQFAPQNVEDASATRRIMRFFKQGMLPSRKLSSDLFLMSPNVFRLSFMNGQDKIRSLNSFKICALTTCQIDFAPDGSYQAYDDPNVISQPVRSIMTLGFTELTPIFWDDYEGDDGIYRSSITELQSTIRDEGPVETGSTAVTSTDDIGY